MIKLGYWNYVYWLLEYKCNNICFVHITEVKMFLCGLSGLASLTSYQRLSLLCGFNSHKSDEDLFQCDPDCRIRHKMPTLTLLTEVNSILYIDVANCGSPSIEVFKNFISALTWKRDFGRVDCLKTKINRINIGVQLYSTWVIIILEIFLKISQTNDKGTALV